MPGRSVAAALLAGAVLTGTAACQDAPAADPTEWKGAASDIAELPAPVPRVDGAALVDARDGSVFVPAGVNWSSFEYACSQGWGYSVLDAGATAAAEAATIARWGANTVRLPLNQDCWLGTRDAPRDDETVERDAAGYQAMVAEFVAAMHDAGLVVVLDLHSRQRPDEPDFGNLAVPDAESLEFWTGVAARFADDPSLMFDLFNEPYSRFDQARGSWAFELDWACWRDGGCQPPVEDDRTAVLSGATYSAVGMAELVARVREAGAEQPLVLSGLDYANDLSGWLDHLPDDDQLVAGFHGYDFKPCVDSACWDQTLGRILDAGRPVLATEYGDTSAALGFARDFSAWARARGVGVLAWVWAAHSGDPLALLDAARRPVDSRYGNLVNGLVRSLADRS